MGSFFDLLFSNQHGGTMWLYVAIVLFAVVFAAFAQPKKYLGTSHINITWYVISFLIMWFFLAFADNGTDIAWYQDFFHNRKHFSDCEAGPVELGYQYYCALIHFSTNDANLFVVITRTISISLVYLSIYLLRDRSVLWMAVLGFACVIYFQMFSALRNSLGYSIAIFSYVLCTRNKMVLSLLGCMLGYSMHRSTIFFIVPVVVYFTFVKSSYITFRRYVLPILIISGFFMLLYSKNIIDYFLLSDDALMGKYGGYTEGKGTQGIMVYFIYLPIAFVLYVFKSEWKKKTDFFVLNLVFVISGFFIHILSYDIGQISRAVPFFTMPFLFYIGYYYRSLWVNSRISLFSNGFTFLLVAYWSIRFMFFISGLFFTNGLANYQLMEF